MSEKLWGGVEKTQIILILNCRWEMTDSVIALFCFYKGVIMNVIALNIHVKFLCINLWFVFDWICIVVAAILTNSSSITEGFCEQDLVNLTLIPECDFSRIEVSIHMDNTNFTTSNFIYQCNNVACVVHEHTLFKYVLTNQTLDFSFPFRHHDHGGKYINFRTTCNDTSILDHAFLKACRK